MNEFLELVLLNVNAVVCAIAAGRLLVWRMAHRPSGFLQGLVIYLLIISCASVSIRTLTGEYYFADWSETVINAALCLFCLMNSANLFGKNRHENQRAGS